MPAPNRTAVALHHVAFESLGLIAPVLAESGWTVSSRAATSDDLSDPAIADADLLIVLGGPMGVYEADRLAFLSAEIALLERRLAQDRPTLGICLGSQLMAKALGARVYQGDVKEIGWGRVTLTEAGRASCLQPLADDGAVVLHWHGDTFDLPDGAVRLASNAQYQNQAFAWRRRALALQFHLEADPQSLEAWYVGHAAELAAAGISVTELRAATTAAADGLRAQSRRVFSAWLRTIS